MGAWRSTATASAREVSSSCGSPPPARRRSRPRTARPERTPSEGVQLLIVDDHTDWRESLAEFLGLEGYTVAVAANGQEALDYLETHSLPRLILLDLKMPVMDGWEFRRRQRQDSALAAIPVVVISGGETPPRSSGFVDAASYLLKPIDFDVLLATVARHCR